MRSSRIVVKTGWRAPAISTAALLTLIVLAFAASAGAASPAGPPAVSTGSAHASGLSVDLTGSINPHEEAATYYFQYGPTLAYGSQTPVANVAAGSTGKVNVSQSVSGLLSGYHYRLVATAANGESANGSDRVYAVKKTKTTTHKTRKTTKQTLKFTFTTKPPVEGVLVGSSLTIAGTLTGPAPGVAGHQIVLQSSPYPSGTAYGNVGAPQTVSATGRFSFFVAHLSHSTRYRVAVVGSSPVYSQVITALASVRVTFHVRTAPSAGLVRLYGTVSPAVTGASVFFQVQQPAKARPNKVSLKTPKNQKAEEKAEEKAEHAETPKYATAFSAPVKRATKTMSRFSIVERVRKTGLYRAYVQVPKGSLASGHSSNIELHAAQKTHKKS
ncbi:MAG TPA: hypothetical protein VMB51_14655 [Solirubrobacteraceae bacterium]|nr:hypothetical protein [Solirubrobacteraceae bacterium]